MFPLLLHDSANIWFKSLDTNFKDKIQHIIESFKLRYWSKHFNMPERFAEFWNMKQQEHQNLEDFVSHCKIVGKRLDADEQTVLYVILTDHSVCTCVCMCVCVLRAPLLHYFKRICRQLHKYSNTERLSSMLLPVIQFIH